MLNWLLFMSMSGNGALDINFHDTYYIVGSVWFNLVMPAFFGYSQSGI